MHSLATSRVCVSRRSIHRRDPACSRGLTLVEVLVVMAIITVLVAILVPAFAVIRTATKRTAGAANLYAIGRTYSAYAAEWDNKIPLCQRAYDPAGVRASSAPLVDNVQRAAFWSAAAPDQNLAPFALRSQQTDFAISKVWTSPATNVVNPFLLTALDAPRPTSLSTSPIADTPPYTIWDRYFNGASVIGGRAGTAPDAAVFVSYFFFAGDPGNMAAGSDGSAVRVYFQDSAGTTLSSRFDVAGGKGWRLSDLSPNELLLQDIALDEPATSGFSDANYISPGAGLVKPSGSVFLPVSNLQVSTQGFALTNSPTRIAGVNALSADFSAAWAPRSQLEKIYYRSPATGTTTTLYVAPRH